MKIILKFLIVICAATVLAACGGNVVATQEEDVVSVAYTDAAMTLNAEMPASTSTPTVTPLPSMIPTLYVPPTLAVVVSPTTQSVSSHTTSYSTANGCNDAIYVSDVTIPDGTVLAPSEAFTKTWEFQNTGTCDWDEDYLITFISGTDMNGETTEIDQEVLSGSVGDISVYLIAPDTDGTYVGYWRLSDGDGTVFGQSVYVMIVVSEDAATLTPTATTTEEATATSISTSTLTTIPEPTSTPEATATFTSTPVPTETEMPTPTESD